MEKITENKLKFPLIRYRIEEQDGVPYIFDIIRKKLVVLTPEEWVRQHLVHYLIFGKNYPAGLFKIETGLKYHELDKRSDVRVYDRSGNLFLLAECKSYKNKIDLNTLSQIASYNKSINAKYLLLTNGLQIQCYQTGPSEIPFQALKEIPNFPLD